MGLILMIEYTLTGNISKELVEGREGDKKGQKKAPSMFMKTINVYHYISTRYVKRL